MRHDFLDDARNSMLQYVACRMLDVTQSSRFREMPSEIGHSPKPQINKIYFCDKVVPMFVYEITDLTRALTSDYGLHFVKKIFLMSVEY